MTTICPTVTAQDITEFNRQQKVAESFAERIHLDLMDGQLAPTKSPDMNRLSLNKGYIYDLHIMYSEPYKYIDQIISLKPHLVIIHAETDTDIPLFATSLRQYNIKTGIAILPKTAIESISYSLPHLQHVLVFGGKLGYHGGKADLGQLAKVSQIKQSNRHIEIAWDGGANIKNIKLIADAGVDVINVGSAIQGSDNPKLAFNQMQSLLAELKNVTI